MCDVQERWSSMKMPRSLCVDTLSMARFSALRKIWCSSWARFWTLISYMLSCHNLLVIYFVYSIKLQLKNQIAVQYLLFQYLDYWCWRWRRQQKSLLDSASIKAVGHL